MLNVLVRKMSSQSAKTLFTDSGLIGDGAIALTIGAPGVKHLEQVAKLLSKAEQHSQNAVCNQDYSYLQYGPKQGSPRYRKEVAKFLSEGYKDVVQSENITVTSGATHGLHLAGSVLLAKNASVFVEDPTYFIAINILRDDLQLNIIPVPTDADGINLMALEKFLEEDKQLNKCEPALRKPFTSLIYVVPNYSNPCGFCMPPDRCTRLVQLARKYDSLIFCDDVYNLLHFDSDKKCLPRLLSYDKPSDSNYNGGHTLSNGTFSKIMAPGLRLGWIEAGPKITDLCKNNNIMWSAGSANHYTSEIVASALELGLEQDHLKDLNAEYQTVVNALCKTLKEHLPVTCKFNWPQGGYFIWIEMPKEAQAATVAKIALEEHKIKVLQGQMCSATGKFGNCIRISFSHYPEKVLVECAEKLCAVIARHLACIGI